MTDRLKAWCHWKRKENHVSEDTMLMVRDIEALLEVVEAVRLATTSRKLTWYRVLSEALAKLEAVK